MARAKKNKRRPGTPGRDDEARWRRWAAALATVAVVLNGLFLVDVLERGVALDDAHLVTGQVVRVEPRGTGRHRREDLTIVLPATMRCPASILGWEARGSTLPGGAIDIACADTIAMPAADRLARETRHVLAGLLTAVVALAFVAGRAITPSAVAGPLSAAILAFAGPTVVHGVVAGALADATALDGSTRFALGTLTTLLMPFVAFAGVTSRATRGLNQPR
jgi:hypothetical protein